MLLQAALNGPFGKDDHPAMPVSARELARDAAACVAAVTLLPLLHGALGTFLPYLPAGWLAAFVLGVFGLVALGMVAPAAVLLRQPAIEAAGVEP